MKNGPETDFGLTQPTWKNHNVAKAWANILPTHLDLIEPRYAAIRPSEMDGHARFS
jgi:hypothetical protein